MPAETKKAGGGGDEDLLPDQDDIAARFAGIEAASRQGAEVELPPVPQITVERPKPKASKGSGGVGLIGGGITGHLASSAGGGDSNLGNVRGMGQAMTIGTGLVASIAVGTGLGWAVDKYLLHSGSGTPWGMIVGFLIGVASGFVNLVRVANELNRQ